MASKLGNIFVFHLDIQKMVETLLQFQSHSPMFGCHIDCHFIHKKIVGSFRFYVCDIYPHLECRFQRLNMKWRGTQQVATQIHLCFELREFSQKGKSIKWQPTHRIMIVVRTRPYFSGVFPSQLKSSAWSCYMPDIDIAIDIVFISLISHRIYKGSSFFTIHFGAQNFGNTFLVAFSCLPLFVPSAAHTFGIYRKWQTFTCLSYLHFRFSICLFTRSKWTKSPNAKRLHYMLNAKRQQAK